MEKRATALSAAMQNFVNPAPGAALLGDYLHLTGVAQPIAEKPSESGRLRAQQAGDVLAIVWSSSTERGLADVLAEVPKHVPGAHKVHACIVISISSHVSNTSTHSMLLPMQAQTTLAATRLSVTHGTGTECIYRCRALCCIL